MATRMLLGLLAGLALGATLAAAPTTARAVALVVGPIGQLWLDALTMTVVPLVFGLLVTGVGSATVNAGAGPVTARAIVWFAALLIGACTLGAVVTLQGLALWPMPGGGQALRAATGAPPPMAPPQDWFSAIIPANPVQAAAEMSMVPLVVFALFFGFAMTRIETELRLVLLRFFEAVVQTMLVIVRWVLLAGPVGVFALGFGVGVHTGVNALGTLAHYVIMVILACLAITFAAYGLVALVGGLPLLAFARAILPVQVVALGTQSSLACLPTMIERASALRSDPAAAKVVLPLAVAIFRAASAAANIAVALYLAKAHGVSPTLAALAGGVFVAAAVSLAAVGLPAQVSFFTTIGPVCLALGTPLAALPLLLAVEALPDIFRTVGNVTCDMAVTRLAARARPSDGGQGQPDDEASAFPISP